MGSMPHGWNRRYACSGPRFRLEIHGCTVRRLTHMRESSHRHLRLPLGWVVDMGTTHWWCYYYSYYYYIRTRHIPASAHQDAVDVWYRGCSYGLTTRSRPGQKLGRARGQAGATGDAGDGAGWS